MVFIFPLSFSQCVESILRRDCERSAEFAHRRRFRAKMRASVLGRKSGCDSEANQVGQPAAVY